MAVPNTEPTVDLNTATVEQLRAALKDAERREVEARDERRASVKPIVSYTLADVDYKAFGEGVMDPSVKTYRLSRTTHNKAELEAAGHDMSGWNRDGGMTYFFNTLSGRFIVHTGGGNIYVDTPWAFGQLEAFLATSPDGGDVTDIVTDERSRRRR